MPSTALLALSFENGVCGCDSRGEIKTEGDVLLNLGESCEEGVYFFLEKYDRDDDRCRPCDNA